MVQRSRNPLSKRSRAQQTNAPDQGRRRLLIAGAAGAAGACAACLGGAFGISRFVGAQTSPTPGAPDAEAPDNGAPLGSPDATAAPQTAEKGLIKRKQSRWFRPAGGNRVECRLCPKHCTLAPGERGGCRVRENDAGTGYTLVYGNPALVQLDPVERKPFFHVVPGERALSVSTAGCPLECRFCEVWDMALVSPEELYAYDLPPQEVIRHARGMEARAVSYAFGEPVAYYEYVEDTAALAHENGLLNLLHTSGYIDPEPLAELAPKLDAVNIDLKSFEPSFYREICGGELEPVLEALKQLKAAGVHIEITTIVIPTLNDDRAMIARMAEWIGEELGPSVPLHFARFYPLYKLANLPPTPVATLDEARATALEAGLHHVYVARVTGHEGENTYCPGCGDTVIKRLGFVVEEVHLNDGRCAACGQEIPGLWG